MQAILDPNLHLDRRVQLWVRAQCVHHNVHFFDNIVEAAADGGPQEIAVEDAAITNEHSTLRRHLDLGRNWPISATPYSDA